MVAAMTAAAWVPHKRARVADGAELLAEDTGEPASAPLPRAAQSQWIQTKADDLVVFETLGLFDEHSGLGLCTGQRKETEAGSGKGCPPFLGCFEV